MTCRSHLTRENIEKIFQSGYWRRVSRELLTEVLNEARTIGFSNDATKEATAFCRTESCTGVPGRVDALIAARVGDFYAFNQLLCPDIDVRNKFNQTVAQIAVIHGHEPVVHFLLENHGALFSEVDSSGMNALHHAVDSNNAALVTLLVHHVPTSEKDKYGRTPLHIAAVNGKHAMLPIFASVNADFSLRSNRGKSVAHVATKFGHIEFLRLLLAYDMKNLCAIDNDGRSLVCEAAKHGHDDILRFLIDQGLRCDVRDNDSCTAAHLAAMEGHVNILHTIVEWGGVECLTLQDKSGMTPLHRAALAGQTDTLRVLKSLQVDPAVVDVSNNTPAHLAAQSGKLDALKVLDGWCSLDGRNEWGKTPAHLAALRGKTECVGFIAVKGYDIMMCRDNDGLLPIDLARENKHAECVQAIEWIGKKLNSMTKTKSQKTSTLCCS